MAKRMTEVEKLARDICWAGFSDATKREDTKAKYWKSIATAARSDYIRDAKFVACLIRKFGIERFRQFTQQTPGA